MKEAGRNWSCRRRTLRRVSSRSHAGRSPRHRIGGSVAILLARCCRRLRAQDTGAANPPTNSSVARQCRRRRPWSGAIWPSPPPVRCSPCAASNFAGGVGWGRPRSKNWSQVVIDQTASSPAISRGRRMTFCLLATAAGNPAMLESLSTTADFDAHTRATSARVREGPPRSSA